MAIRLEGVLLQADFASPQHALLVLSLDATLSDPQQAPFVSAEALALALSQQARLSFVVAAVLESAANNEAAKAAGLFINSKLLDLAVPSH